jgi:hypothetical protein
VPDEIVKCLVAFLDACYIARCQNIDANALRAFDDALKKFRDL